MAKSRRVRSRRGVYAWGLKPPTTQGGGEPPVGGGVLCPYVIDTDSGAIFGTGPLDSISTVSEVTTVTLNQNPNSVASNKTGTALTATDNAHLAANLGSSGVVSFGQSIPLEGTGIVAWEAEVDINNLVMSNIGTFLPAAKLNFTMGTINGTTFAQVVGQAQLALRYNDDNERMQFDCNYAAQDTAAGLSSVQIQGGVGIRTLTGVERLGFYYNLATKRLGITNSLDGDLGYLVDFTSGDYIGQNITDHLPLDSAGMAQVLVEAYYSADETTGFVSAATFQNASDYHLNYPAGVTNQCGAALTPTLKYPLDADETTIINGFGYTGKANASFNDQRGGYIIQSQLAQSEQYLMAPQDAATNTNPQNFNGGGLHCFEVRFRSTGYTPTGAGTTEFMMDHEFTLSDVTVPLSSPPILIEVARLVNGNAALTVQLHESVVPGDPDNIIDGYAIAATGGEYDFVLGVAIDGATNTVRLWIDGVELVLDNPVPSNWYGVGQVFPAMSFQQWTADPNGAENVELSTHYITEPFWFTTPFPAGSKDINSNVFN